jgi:biotin carboxyl carrier protein
MRYYVTLDSRPDAKPLLVDVEALPSGRLVVKVDGREVAVDAMVPGAPAGGASVGVGAASATGGASLSVVVDNRVVDLTLEGTPPEVGVVAGGTRAYVRVESERARTAEAARKTKGGAGDAVVKSPMPGRVVKVLVKDGDEVEAGQPLLVIEAMKMENEVKAKAKAKIVTVHVTAGATVEGQAKLITLG